MAFLLAAYASVFGALGAYWLWLRRRRERLLAALGGPPRQG
jgi:hypothetical protein